MSQSIRSLAAEAGLSTDECLSRLRADGVAAGKGSQKLCGEELLNARSRLGLNGKRHHARPGAGRRLDQAALLVRLLRPLREKGKVGPTHTTPIENVWGRGVPDHQKAEAKELADRLLREGALDQKVSQGRRHVWLTVEGQHRLSLAEAEAETAPAQH